MHTLICVTFSLPPGVGGLIAASACGSSWTFLFTFLFCFAGYVILDESRDFTFPKTTCIPHLVNAELVTTDSELNCWFMLGWRR